MFLGSEPAKDIGIVGRRERWKGETRKRGVERAGHYVCFSQFLFLSLILAFLFFSILFLFFTGSHGIGR